LIYVDEGTAGAGSETSFDEKTGAAMSTPIRNGLKADGLGRGDRVAGVLRKSLELPIVHMAAFAPASVVGAAVHAVRWRTR